MRSLALSAAVTAALAAAVPVAWGSGMHPELGARLAGMGEHGVVNLQVKSKQGKVCWTFDLPTTHGITGASIHVGSAKRSANSANMRDSASSPTDSPRHNALPMRVASASSPTNQRQSRSSTRGA